MKLYLKLPRSLVLQIKGDLHRPHSFAHERVGFLTIGATRLQQNDLLLLGRDYRPVEDADYEPDMTCGARIGGTAFQKALQHAYRSRSGLVHLHIHGGSGVPVFSGTDLRSGGQFVPGFFETIPSIPHGMVVLSGDRAAGMFWFNKTALPTKVDLFAFVGAPLIKFEAA
jgi:hypothetical protein